MENRNSRKGSSRRPSSSNNSNKGNSSYNKSQSTNRNQKGSSFGGGKSRSDSSFNKSGSSFNKFDKKKEFRPGFKTESSDTKKPFSSGNRYSKPFGKSSGSSWGEGSKEGGKEFKSERKPFNKDREPRGDFNKKSSDRPYTPKREFKTDEGRPSFKNKPFENRSSGDKSSTGEFQRRPKKTFDDKKSEIKSKFVSKGRSFNETKPGYKPTLEKGPRPKPAPQIKRSAEERASGIRLNRYIANSGVCSRRDADLLISSGEITVNGNIVTEMGYIVQATDVVKYSGRTLKREKLVYVILNKPKDFITTTNDPDDRRTVMDLVASAAQERLFPVGRLDRNTTGLLLLTNDGELAEKLSHPSNKIKKIYQVTLDRPLEDKDFEKIQKGVHLEDGIAEVDDIAIITKDKINLGLEIHIGRNRIVRRIFEALGYNVEKLDRVLYAELTKKDLARGQWRYLTEQEVINLKNMKKK